MSLSHASPAMNTILKMDDGLGSSPVNYVTIGELRTLPGPAMSTTVQKVTNHSGLDPWEEVLPTLLSAGGMALEVNFYKSDASQDSTTGFIYVWKSRARRTWRIYLPDGTLLFECSGYITKVTLGPFAVDGVQLASFELTFTGKPTILGVSA